MQSLLRHRGVYFLLDQRARDLSFAGLGAGSSQEIVDHAHFGKSLLCHGTPVGCKASQPVLPRFSIRAKAALRNLNSHIPEGNIEAVGASLSRPLRPTLIENNRWFHGLLIDGGKCGTL